MRTSVLLAFVALLVGSCYKEAGLPVTNARIEPRDLLSDKKYQELVVEIAYESGYAPDANAVNDLRNFLFERLNKPKGINLVMNAVPYTAQPAYGLSQVSQLELKYRKNYCHKKKAAVFIFYAWGDYAGSSGSVKILGLQYRSSSFVVFGKTISEHSGGIGQPTRRQVEATVFQHEFGHLMGLVNNGSAMASPHEDDVHAHHCLNEDCLMYHLAQNTRLLDWLTGTSTVPQLDAHCLNDLRKNGGK